MAKGFFRGLFGDKKTSKIDEDQGNETPLPAELDKEPENQSDTRTPPGENRPDPTQTDAVSEIATPQGEQSDATVPSPEPDPSAPLAEESNAAQNEIAEQNVTPPPSAEEIPSGESDDEQPKKKRLFSRLTSGLSRTSSKLSGGITGIFTKRKLDQETLDDLEDLLVSADLGVAVASRVVEDLAKDRFDKEISTEEVRTVLASAIAESLTPCEAPLVIKREHTPHVVLMTGVNGAGKTTTIGKLAAQYNQQGLKTMLVAADTFRAAAIEQLKVWGERTGAEVITRDQGADAAGLVFDAMTQAKNDNVDVLLIDTAGRLQNRTELMDELAKIVRVIKKNDSSAPHDVVLVLDATVGQNAISQTGTFTEIAGVTGLVMTKLDGTAKGGVLVSLAEKFKLPIHYIGVGEAVHDLQPFVADDYSKALTGALSESSPS